MTKLMMIVLLSLLVTACNGGSSAPMSTVYTPTGPVFVMPVGNNSYMVI